MHTVAEAIRELMELQQMSVRKVSARIAEQHGGSPSGYTQQISRILNDPTYDPTLSTVQKILSALNVSLWQTKTPIEPSALSGEAIAQLTTRLDQLSADVADLKSEMSDLKRMLTTALQREPVSR
ncbi:helix-turn-helix transcriptional regulator [Microcoleus sp. FACHB-1515]|uniref:helix-turn-helix domain-containing protein n=1 Tax=Cyanophyceae TaxID=3028117 RepID=UPI001683BD77|nr:helix-turn-helix transcriptional regulator [Microcoleus sp. FACHB-1515]MBD2092988.1 helix-turn-helix transcriptional regulator [Microcoleus sp. FACHB-1515]